MYFKSLRQKKYMMKKNPRKYQKWNNKNGKGLKKRGDRK